MAYRAGANQFIILAEPEPIFNLPAGQAGLDDPASRPIGIVGNDYVLAKPLLFLANLVEILAKVTGAGCDPDRSTGLPQENLAKSAPPAFLPGHQPSFSPTLSMCSSEVLGSSMIRPLFSR
jgi:hypothetical protein